tara:strand:- start:9043 stop:9738 length:696 start_codon:yes stop_codon:yes gene_type:complete
MIISEETLEVLKNFATINPNIVFKPGFEIKTISEAKTILASSKIVEDFQKEFGVYDLNEFLSVYNLIETPQLDFEEKAVVIKNNVAGAKVPIQQSVRYFFSDPEILTTPQKDIQMPNAELGVNIEEDVLNQIRRAASVLGHNELSIKGDNGVVTASVVDTKDATSNHFEIELDRDNSCKNEFNFVVSIPNLKLLPGDYFVSISSKLISNWTNSNYPVEYFIALEKNSVFNV